MNCPARERSIYRGTKIPHESRWLHAAGFFAVYARFFLWYFAVMI
jgi:hypothetical protein